MKQRSQTARHGPEFKGVVKKIAGKLTNRPDVEEEGREEMIGQRRSADAAERSARRARTNPDPHRRG